MLRTIFIFSASYDGVRCYMKGFRDLGLASPGILLIMFPPFFSCANNDKAFVHIFS